MENLETINQSLRDHFGIDSDDSESMYRVVFSNDQYEKRETSYTDTGVALLRPEVRLLPKYPWIVDKYILEERCLVPDVNLKELAGLKKSYEVLYAFADDRGRPIRPSFVACKFIIDSVRAAKGKKSMASYKPKIDPSIKNKNEYYESRKAELDDLQNKLFGDESSLNQQTIGESGSAIIVPRNFERS